MLFYQTMSSKLFVIIKDQMMAVQIERWSEKKWPETCPVFSLTPLQENEQKTRVFSQYFSEVVTTKLWYKEKWQNAFWC